MAKVWRRACTSAPGGTWARMPARTYSRSIEIAHLVDSQAPAADVDEQGGGGVVEVVVGEAGGPLALVLRRGPVREAASIGMGLAFAALASHLQAAGAGLAAQRSDIEAYRLGLPDAGHAEGGHDGQVPRRPGMAGPGVGLRRGPQQAADRRPGPGWTGAERPASWVWGRPPSGCRPGPPRRPGSRTGWTRPSGPAAPRQRRDRRPRRRRRPGAPAGRGRASRQVARSPTPSSTASRAPMPSTSRR